MPLHNQVLISILFWALFCSTFTLQSSDIRQQQTGLFRPTSWLERHFKNVIEDSEMADLSALTQLKLKSELMEPPTLQSSIDEDVKLYRFPQFGACEPYGISCACCRCCTRTCRSCRSCPVCSIACTSFESRCGQTCTHVTTFAVSVVVSDSSYYQTTSTRVNNSCETLSSACLAAVVVVPAVVVVVLAIVIAVSLSVVGLILPAGETNPISLDLVDQVVIGQFPINQNRTNHIAINNIKIPVEGFNFPDDGCGDGSVRFANGTCYPVLQRGPCNEPNQWVTVDPIQLKGRCTPRLCGRQRVFVSRDGLCHDINDPLVCHGGRRLYYTAFGDPICDCPIGQYPFPGARDDCVPLFTQGPCPQRNVVFVDPQGKLGCKPSHCQSGDRHDSPIQQLIPDGSGFCYALGSSGPCPARFQLFGFDVFKRRRVCLNVKDPSLPYFSTPEEDQLIDSVYNQRSAENNDMQGVLFEKLGKTNGDKRRQGANSFGVFQVPSSFPESLLNPCRPGVRSGINYKCANPFLPNTNINILLQAVSSEFRCPSTSFLQATGQCVRDRRSASCGPSFRYDQVGRQCRSFFHATNSTNNNNGPDSQLNFIV